MTLQEKAASLARDEKSRDEIVALLASREEMAARIDTLEQQLDWLKRQMFGSKSERRLDTAAASQMMLGESFAGGTPEAAPQITVPSHARRTRAPLGADASDVPANWFDSSVPVREIKIPNPEADAHPASAYDVVGQKKTYRVAQYPGAYVLLCYVRDVIKLKSEDEFLCPPAPAAVFDRSIADVSFLAGLLVDKFAYHLPLYRQHQRLGDAGIHISRASLTNFVHRSAALLEPIYRAQLDSILESRVLAMDETPIRAGREPNKKGKMQGAYFWPMYGDRGEVAFPFAASRSLAVVRELLKPFSGTLLTDGYAVYDRYAAAIGDIQRAQCWSHARRKFIEAETIEPELCKTALEFIARLYACEAAARDQKLEPEQILALRAEQSRAVADQLFQWLRDTLRDKILLPSNLFTKAATYALEREASLRVFLDDPDVPLDTNHLEREIRPIAVGRKNWLFCWTEVGAEYVGVVQSLIRTCRLQGIDPYTYLIDVLQRVATHPAADVQLLTPRLWKQHFADQPLRSDLQRSQDSAG